MKTFRYNLVFQSEPEGGFTVIVPALPGCVSYGKNLKQAKAMAQDAITGYLQSLRKHGKNIPNDNDSFITVTEVSLEENKFKKISYA
ncbi:MAG: type II toxin-antitoxin system HicB family antitoxin [Candidatus Doudnabacteria bacterium]|nr:type II toxin-antitoxin system HicB family antitoxin [Candidatus Doudnabacteria bacterium]